MERARRGLQDGEGFLEDAQRRAERRGAREGSVVDRRRARRVHLLSEVAMADVTLRHEIDTDEDTYWSKIVFSEPFNKEMYEQHMKFPAWTLLDSKDDDQKTYRKVRVEPKVGNLPGPVKKVLGDRISYVEE